MATPTPANQPVTASETRHNYKQLFMITALLTVLIAVGYTVYAYQRIDGSETITHTPLSPVLLDRTTDGK